MADDRMIDAYLRELRFSVARIADADDIVDEADDHLHSAAEALIAEGRTEHEAESEAVARFGSAELVAKVCLSEAKRGAAVPTTRTRWAGLALALAPVALVLGLIGNETFDVHDASSAHGTSVLLMTLAFPALIAGLWALQARCGGLGWMGRIALGLAVLSPILSLAAGWGALALLAVLLPLAVLMFGIAMLRASVLPVAPLAVVIAGPAVVLVLGTVAVVLALADRNADGVVVLSLLPLLLTTAGLCWLGLHLWSETAVDVAGRGRLATS